MTARFSHSGSLRLLLLTLAGCFLPSLADAAGLDIDACSQQAGFTPQQGDYTSKVVFCVQEAIHTAVITMLDALSQYMAPVVAAMAIIAVIVYGARMMSGHSNFSGRTVGFLARLCIVTTFSYNLGGLGDWVFAMLQDLLYLAAGGYLPWQDIDGFLGQLFGFGPDLINGGFLNLSQGMVGLVGASLMTSSMGAVVFIAGMMGILNLILFIFQVVFLYLMAIMMIGFMLLISPLVVPLGMFFSTERYVKRWMDITFSAILTPVLLFAFLWMFMGGFGALIQNFYDILGGNDFRAYWKINNPAFSWVMPGDPNMNTNLQDRVFDNPSDPAQTHKAVRNIPPVQNTIDPFKHVGFNAGLVNKPGIDFGTSNINIMQQLIFAFTTMWIFATLMKEMAGKIPSVASSIAQAANHLAMEPLSARQMVAEAKQNIAAGAGAVLGGRAGAALAGEANKGVKEVGGLMGAAIGQMVGRRL